MYANVWVQGCIWIIHMIHMSQDINTFFWWLHFNYIGEGGLCNRVLLPLHTPSLFVSRFHIVQHHENAHDFGTTYIVHIHTCTSFYSRRWPSSYKYLLFTCMHNWHPCTCTGNQTITTHCQMFPGYIHVTYDK